MPDTWDAFPTEAPNRVPTPVGDDGRPIPRITVSPGQATASWDDFPENKPTDYGGLAKQGGIGVVKGVIGAAGLSGDMRELASKGVNAVSKWAGYEIPESTVSNATKFIPGMGGPTSEQLRGGLEKVTGPLRKPQNQTEADAETVGEFIPAAITGPGGIARKLGLQAVLPAATTIVAGRYSDQNPYVKALAGFLAGGTGAALSAPSSVQQIIRAKLPTSVTEQDITRAGQLIEHAQTRGVQLTWPEALSRITGQPVLTDTQRVLESHAQTRTHMNDFFSGRPAQLDQAALGGFDRIAPGTANPSSIGREIGAAANETTGDVRKAINAASEPFYKSAESVLLDAREMAAVKAIPGFEEARKAVRNNPQLNSYVAHLPDNSVGFLNEVKKWFDQQGKNAASKFNPQANQQVRAVNDQASHVLSRIGEFKSPDYGVALQIQQQAREQFLQPLLDGPLGRLARKDVTTQKAIDALFPSNPLPNSHNEIATAVTALSAKNPGAATQLVRAHLESVWNEAARELQGGANQFSGARFAKTLVGNPQQRANLQAAIESLPNGPTRWQGFERLLDIMAATGARQPKGSLTAFNALEVGSMTTGGIQQLAAKGLSPSKWMNFANDTFNSWSLGRNLDQLASLITNPRATEAFRQISRVPAGSDRALVMTGRLIGQLSASTTEQRTKPAQTNGR